MTILFGFHGNIKFEKKKKKIYFNDYKTTKAVGL